MPQSNRNGHWNKVLPYGQWPQCPLWSVLRGASLAYPPVQCSAPPLPAFPVPPVYSLHQPHIAMELERIQSPSSSPTHCNITSVPEHFHQALLPSWGKAPRAPFFLFNSFIRQTFNEHVLLRYCCGNIPFTLRTWGRQDLLCLIEEKEKNQSLWGIWAGQEEKGRLEGKQLWRTQGFQILLIQPT